MDRKCAKILTTWEHKFPAYPDKESSKIGAWVTTLGNIKTKSLQRKIDLNTVISVQEWLLNKFLAIRLICYSDLPENIHESNVFPNLNYNRFDSLLFLFV